MSTWQAGSRYKQPHRTARLLGLGASGSYVEDWRDLAACLGEDPELFFPVGDGPVAEAQIEVAKSVCRSCRVIEQCERYALRTGMAGVWGGLDDAERRQKRRGPTA